MALTDKIQNAANNAGKFILQSIIGAPARQIISLGLDVVKGGFKAAGIESSDEFQPRGISTVFLGDEPIKAKSTQVKEAAKEGKGTFGVKGPAGTALLGGMALLDTAPIGGPAKKGAKVADKIGDILKNRKKIGPIVDEAEKLVDAAVPYERKFKEVVKDFADQVGLKSTRGLLKNDRRFGPAGKEISERFDLMREEATLNKARDIVNMTDTLKGLSKEELDNFTSVAEGMAQPMSQRVARAAQEWDDIRKKIAGAAEEAGLQIVKADGTKIPFTPRDNFFPHLIPREVINELVKNSGKRNALFNQMVQRGQAQNIAEAESIFRKYIQAHTTKKYGHLEKAREVDFPIYERDPRKVLTEYMSFAHDRLAQAKYFGPGDDFAKKAFEQMRLDGKDYEMAERIFNRVIGNEIVDPLAQKASAYARTYEVITKLGLGAISNLGQLVNTATRTGIYPALKAQTEAIIRPAASRRFSQLTGNIGDVINSAARAAGSDTDIADKFLRLVQFQRVELNNRTVAAMAGRNYARLLFKNLKRTPKESRRGYFAYRRLKAMGVDVDEALKTGKLSDRDELRAGFNVVRDTQFSADPENLPFYWSSPAGKALTQFKSFSFNQAVFLKKFVLDEARQGNIKPLIIYAVVGEAMGEVVGDLKAKARGRDRVTGPERFVDNLLMVGGLGLVSDVYQSIRYGTLTGGSQLLSFIAGPAVSDFVEVLQGLGTLVTEGKSKNILKKALRSVPVAGPYLAQSVYPTSQKYQAKGAFLPEALYDFVQKEKKANIDLPSLPGVKNSSSKSSSLPPLPGL